MEPTSRDRISVDLRGLKVALAGRAQALGMSPSGLVRTVLAEALGQPAEGQGDRNLPPKVGPDGTSARLCVRMSRQAIKATMEASRRQGLSPGQYVAGLVAEVPVLASGGGRADHVAALMTSTAELATLSRNVHRLTALLRQADVAPARSYRDMLDGLAGEVHQHLELASRVLAELRLSAGHAGPAMRRVQ